MRILALTSNLPYPPTWGAAIRNHRLLKYLAGRHDLTLVTYAAPDAAESVQAMESLGIRLLTVPPPQRGRWKRFGQLASITSSRSYSGRMYVTSRMQAQIDEELAKSTPQVVLVESSLLMGHRFSAAVPIVLDEHNLEFELLERMATAESSPVRRRFAAHEARKLRREEIASWRRAFTVVFTSDREREIARSLEPSLVAETVPNGVDLDYFAPVDEMTTPGAIVFTGVLDYRPNEEAVTHFCRDILPLVVKLRPHAHLTVVGANIPSTLRGLARPGVEFTGRVPDVRPYLRAAAAVVVPIRMGSGTRLKVLEAMAMGKGIVSTSIGYEGIMATAGRELLAADEPAAFAAAVVSLLDDPEKAKSLGCNGRRLVETTYGWDALAARMNRVLVSAVP